MQTDALPENLPEEPSPASSSEPTLTALHEELIAASSENRRGNRRMLDILKGFGAMLEAISKTAVDTHQAVRAIPTATGSTSADETDHLPALIDLADRIDRIRTGFDRPPPAPISWWPAARKSATAWRTAWDTQAAALAILHSHLTNLLERADLRRIPAIGQPFDPQSMTAVEAIIDPSLPDHSVIAEILPGWRSTTTGRIIRLAHVKVSRKSL
jgi:molecular chaperone GrpE